MNDRPRTQDSIRDNLNDLCRMYEWSGNELARRSGVGLRAVAYYLDGTRTPDVPTCDKLAAPFGLTGWHLLIPGLPQELLRSPSLRDLLPDALAADDDGRALIAQIAKREAGRG